MLYSFSIANQRGKKESIKFGKPGGNPHVLEWKIPNILCYMRRLGAVKETNFFEKVVVVNLVVVSDEKESNGILLKKPEDDSLMDVHPEGPHIELFGMELFSS